MTRREQQVTDTRNHLLSVFDGAVMAGSLVERAGRFDAFDIAGRCLGTFSDLRTAARSLPAADTLSDVRTGHRNSLSGGRRHG
jgi:hypothetical protein